MVCCWGTKVFRLSWLAAELNPVSSALVAPLLVVIIILQSFAVAEAAKTQQGRRGKVWAGCGVREAQLTLL